MDFLQRQKESEMRPDKKSFSIQCCLSRLKEDVLSQRYSLI